MKLSVRLTLRGNGPGKQSVDFVAEVERASEAEPDTGTHGETSRPGTVVGDRAEGQTNDSVVKAALDNQIDADRLNAQWVSNLNSVPANTQYAGINQVNADPLNHQQALLGARQSANLPRGGEGR